MMIKTEKVTKETVESANAVLTKCGFNEWETDEIEKDIKDEKRLYLVIKEEMDIVGVCLVWCAIDTADLCNICILPEYRRQGLAEILLLAALDELGKRGCERLLLEVRQSNMPAIALYEKLGFQEISRRKQYYREPVEDAIVMQRDCKAVP